MPQSSGQFSGIFICYRREDSAGHAGRLYDRLAAHFGDERIFMDLDQMEPGEDFVRVIGDAVGSCAVLLALIGRNWLASRNEGGRRLDDHNDFVRLEISAALGRGVRVIPVLVQGALMPRPEELPGDLSPLSRLHALELSDLRWKHDVDYLVSALEKVTAPRPVATRRPKASKFWAAAILAVLAVVLFSVSVFRRMKPTDPPPPEVEQPEAGPTPFKNGIGMEFVWIPPGSFLMGSQSDYDDEKPRHYVSLSTGFYMSRHEVTQAQWTALMGRRNPSYFSFKSENMPVEQVSWDDAVAFTAKLSSLDDGGMFYRLPSEAEWEYAAQARREGRYAGTHASDLNATAWYVENSSDHTHPVGSKQPNDLGLFDMRGNVWEWCQDWYHDSYVGAPADGSAWVRGGYPTDRVLRGGSFYSSADDCRLTSRSLESAKTRSSAIGFRVVAIKRL